jgi:hypothetical protein
MPDRSIGQCTISPVRAIAKSTGRPRTPVGEAARLVLAVTARFDCARHQGLMPKR